MQINQQCLDRIKEAKLSGPGLAGIFESLALLITPDGGTRAMTLAYNREGDDIKDGDLIPVVILTLTPASLIPENPDAQDCTEILPQPSAGLPPPPS